MIKLLKQNQIEAKLSQDWYLSTKKTIISLCITPQKNLLPTTKKFHLYRCSEFVISIEKRRKGSIDSHQITRKLASATVRRQSHCRRRRRRRTTRMTRMTMTMRTMRTRTRMRMTRMMRMRWWGGRGDEEDEVMRVMRRMRMTRTRRTTRITRTTRMTRRRRRTKKCLNWPNIPVCQIWWV